MLVVFRADASLEMGSGHVMRCLTLADELKREGHECHFICRQHDGHLGNVIVNKGHTLYLLPCMPTVSLNGHGEVENGYANWLGSHWEQDARQTCELISSLSVDWLVVDHYGLDFRWEQEILKIVPELMVIDDLANRKHACSLLLDQNLGRRVHDYCELVPSATTLLLGPSYALLRPAFGSYRDSSIRRRAKGSMRKILISLGGTDQSNLTGKVLDQLADVLNSQEIECDVVLGNQSPHLESIRSKSIDLPFRTRVLVNVSDMEQLMLQADLSIGGAGGTSWERCCMALPTLVLILADNQLPGAKALAAQGAAEIIGTRGSDQEGLRYQLNRLKRPEILKSMSDAAAGVTDGKGVFRVAQHLTRMCE